MKINPSHILKLYYAVSFILGIILTLFLVHWVANNDIGVRGAAIITLSFNVLLIMLLPLVLDWAESYYFKARFLALEEIAKTDPDLALALEEQCKRLAIPRLKLAVVDNSPDELFSYGLWRINPRLVLSNSLLKDKQRLLMIPSVEAELARFASQDRTLVFLFFIVIQEILQISLLSIHFIH